MQGKPLIGLFKTKIAKMKKRRSVEAKRPSNIEPKQSRLQRPRYFICGKNKKPVVKDAPAF
jgi:hypothetical protein